MIYFYSQMVASNSDLTIGFYGLQEREEGVSPQSQQCSHGFGSIPHQAELTMVYTVSSIEILENCIHICIYEYIYIHIYIYIYTLPHIYI